MRRSTTVLAFDVKQATAEEKRGGPINYADPD
jgi:hypothetical protein